MNLFSAQFSAEIRAHLAKHQIPVSQLQELLQVSRSHAYKLYNGTAEWSLNEAIKASEWAGISLDSLIQTPEGLSA